MSDRRQRCAEGLVVLPQEGGVGRAGYFGGATAGPVFKDLMSFALRDLKIPPTGTTAPVAKLTAG